MEQKSIPFNVPCYIGTEDQYILQVLKNQKLSGDGLFNKKCVELMKKMFPESFVTLTPSCTAALEMAFLLLNLKPGDEVILPSYTFTSTATAVTLFGATPVFVGVDESLNLDLKSLELAMTEKTKAICVVHYAGFSCDMNLLLNIAKKRNLFVVEDAAQAFGALYNDRPLGSFGDIAAFSFHETKNIVCGEGGAIVVNNPSLYYRAEVVRDKGTDRQRFLRGEIDKYTWQDKGSSYLLGELPAAYLYGQLLEAQTITQKRRQLFDLYDKAFVNAEKKGFLKRPQKTKFNVYNGHIYYLILNSEQERNDLQAFLKVQNIGAVSHYVPLHSSEAGVRFGRAVGDLKLTQKYADCLLRLPMFFQLTEDQAQNVVKSVLKFFEK